MFKSGFVMLSLIVVGLSSRADTHIFGGAVGTNQNDKCLFSNGALFNATTTTFYFPQVLRTNGLNAGNYRGDVLTFAGLAATGDNSGPIANCAALGAQLAVQVVSVDGPSGGSFAFWEGDGENDLGHVTFSVPVGTTNGTNYFIMSENNGVPGTDPYGHIHGREFTTSALGTYIVGFRVIDISTNGVGGGPIHSPSDVLPVQFQAGVRIDTIQTITNHMVVSFRGAPGISNVLEATDSLIQPNWQRVAAPLRGTSAVQSSVDTNAVTGTHFYRLRQLNNLP